MIEETPVCAGELAGEAGFIAVHQFEGVGLVGQEAEGESGPRSFVLRLVGDGLFADLVVQIGALQFPEANLTPAADDHGFDVSEFDRIPRLQLLVESFGKGGETIGGFAIDYDSGGKQTVIQSVACGSELALGRDRPVGFGAIGARGFNLTWGTHSFGFSIGTGGGGGSGKWFGFCEKWL